MIDFSFIASITTGQWIMLWWVGLAIFYFSTAWKDEMGGLIGPIIYILISIFIVFIWVVWDLFIYFWYYFG